MRTILNKIWYYAKILTLKSKKFIVVDHVEMDKRILLKNTLAYHVKAKITRMECFIIETRARMSNVLNCNPFQMIMIDWF